MLLLLALACGSPADKPTPDSDDTGDSGGTGDSGDSVEGPVTLRVVEGPAATLVTGGTVTVTVEAVQAGVRVDHPGDVTLTADADVLATAPLVDGLATLTAALPGCRVGPLTLSSPDLPPILTADVSVAPTVSVVTALPLAIAAGPLPTVTVQLLDASGAPADLPGDYTLAATAPLGGTVTAAPVAGTLTFDAATVADLGPVTLTVTGPPGCPVDVPVGEALVGATVSREPTFLPSARVGEEYASVLPFAPAVAGPLPEGLSLADAWVLGTPTTAAAARFEVAALDGDVARLLPVRLAVLPSEDDALPAPTFAPEAPGPWPTDSVELTIPTITVSTGTYRNVAVRVAFPSDGAGGVAEGRFPLVVFHHAAHTPSTIYDHYTDLHGHWASHGAIVASVDSHVNVDGRSQSWDNLTDMSTFQLAAADLLRGGGTMFAGHVDTERVVVSGHSRGGGASLISLWRDPTLFGAICFEPVSPLQTPGQDWSDPEGNGDRALPDRPVLILTGSEDLDEPWPLPDISFEQAVGPALRVTLHGANHEDTYDADTPGGKTSTSTIPVTARHDLDQAWSTAFLYRYGALGATEGDLAWEATLFGPPRTTLSTEGVTVQSRRDLAGGLSVDGFSGDAGTNEVGDVNVGDALTTDTNDEPYADGLRAVDRYDERGPRVGRWAHARHVAWEDPAAELDFALPDVDVSLLHALRLRVERDCPPPYDGACPDTDVDLDVVDLDVVVWDADGHEAEAPLGERLGDRGIVGRHFGVGRVPLDALVGVDLERVSGVGLRFGALGWKSGDLWVDDVGFE